MSIAQVINYWKPIKENSIFVDLGSGLGKGVLTAALSYPFAEWIGIEYLENIYNKSLTLAQEFTAYLNNLLETDEEACKNLKLTSLPKLTILHGDFTEVDWSNADFVLANATCYVGDLMDKILEKLNNCKGGMIQILRYWSKLLLLKSIIKKFY